MIEHVLPQTVSIIIPAHNEQGYITDCLSALCASDPVPGWSVEVLVAANGCRDQTAVYARKQAALAAEIGWDLQVLEIAEPGKLNALNQAEEIVSGAIRIYLDADVCVSPTLISCLIVALDRDEAAYASGTPEVIAPSNWLGRAYARMWARLPFVSNGVPGFGVFAVNAAGRQRWGQFPDIIADDMFVRLQFAPHERIRVAPRYFWPLVAGLHNLIQVRRRQDRGVAELVQNYPDLKGNAEETRPGLLWMVGQLLRDPIGFCTYCGVSLAVRLPILRSGDRWSRGR